MASKKALERLVNFASFFDCFEEYIEKDAEQIEKDLDVLETLLKYLPIKLELKKDRNNQDHAYLVILSKERYLPVNYEYEIPMKKYELLKEYLKYDK